MPEPAADTVVAYDEVIRIQLKEPIDRKWELCTQSSFAGRAFPTIQLFDCEGNLLVETNDDNLSIKSSDVDGHLRKKHFTSVGAGDVVRHQAGLKKNYTIHGDDGVYTRFYKSHGNKSEENLCDQIESKNAHTLRIPSYRRSASSPSGICSAVVSDNSSYKSSDNESSAPQPFYSLIHGKPGTLLLRDEDLRFSRRRRRRRRSCRSEENSQRIDTFLLQSKDDISDSFDSVVYSPSESSIDPEMSYASKKRRRKVCKSASYNAPVIKSKIRRTNTEIFPPKDQSCDENMVRTMSFLDTYLRSLPSRNKDGPPWLEEVKQQVELRDKPKNRVNELWRRGMVIDDEVMIDQCMMNEDYDSEVRKEIKRRMKKYHRVLSCSDYWTWKRNSSCQENLRRSSECASSTSSESFDEADRVLMRLKRRISVNQKRERKGKRDSKRRQNDKDQADTKQIVIPTSLQQGGKEGCRGHAVCVMGASASRHSRRSLGGRRAQSSGDLCNGEPRQQDSCSVAGSATGDGSTWNSSRSLPSHLDGRRRCPCGECGSSDNNHCGTPTPRHPRHFQRFNHHYGCKSDLEPVWKLQDPGCDQGYGSERSPEEEFPPSMPVEEDYQEQEVDLRQMYPFINDENTFTVRVEKDRRGLGLSVAGGAPVSGGGGGSGLIRIRRLYAAQPAWATGRLRPGDLLLAANGISLTGLTTYEALEVLRTTPPIVELVVCRPEPEVLECLTPPGGPPEPPLRQPPPDPLNLHPPRVRAPPPPPPASDYEEPQPIFDVKFGEFDIVMTKVNGSLGFTLRKEDHSALGHYVRALVREPALSDGRIQPGDRIVAVNDVPMSTLSHAEAVSFLRRCGPVARLRLYRDQCGTPPSPSAASPATESDTTTMITRPKPPLRQEAVNMLCDIAARKLTSDDGNGSPCVSPRRYKKLTRHGTGYSQNSDTMHPYSVICPSTTAENSDNETNQTLSYQSTDTADTTYSVVTEGRPVRPTSFNGQLFDNIKPPSRPDFLDLGGPPTPINNRKLRLHFSVAAHGYELNNLDNDVLDAPNIYQDMSQNGGSSYLTGGQNFQINDMSNEPISMPIELNATHDMNENRFSHKNPAYQSAVIHPSSNSNHINYSDREEVKWKTLSPDKERKHKIEQNNQKEEPEKPKIVHYPDEDKRDGNSEPRILTVELNRGWNSRLGFSVQCHPDSGQSFISAIYSDSVAAKDGRLRQGDIILQVNDENITSMTTPQVIDLLRILRGSICITVLRQ